MQPMWLCPISSRSFEGTLENAQPLKMSMGVFFFIHFLSKVTICCQKLPKIDKCCQLLPIVVVKRYYFLLVITCWANDQGKMSRGQNILAQKTKCCRTECHPTIQFLLKIKKCTFAPEVIVFRRPNTNIIRPSENDRIRIRIIFGLPKMTEYEYE